jgi:hypothetical protein
MKVGGAMRPLTCARAQKEKGKQRCHGTLLILVQRRATPSGRISMKLSRLSARVDIINYWKFHECIGQGLPDRGC